MERKKLGRNERMKKGWKEGKKKKERKEEGKVESWKEMHGCWVQRKSKASGSNKMILVQRDRSKMQEKVSPTIRGWLSSYLGHPARESQPDWALPPAGCGYLAPHSL